MRKEFLEGLLGSAIGSIKSSLDEVYSNHQNQFKSQLKQIQQTYYISRVEIADTLRAIDGQHEATLSPRHRDTVKVFRHFYEMMDQDHYNPLFAKRMGNGKVVRFVKELITFLKVAHNTLHIDTDKKDRRLYVDDYTGGSVSNEENKTQTDTV